MAEFPALPLFTDSYLGDTRHLTTLQHGAYLLMLIVAWRTTDCSLPDDDIYLARITGLDRRTWMANKTSLLSFWRLNEQQKWEQGRLKDERNYVEQLRSKNASAGRASALKRKNRASTTVQPESNENSTPIPIPILIVSKEESTKEELFVPTFAFDIFWGKYPKQRQGNKKKAFSAWQQALTTATEEEILNGLEAYIGSSQVRDGFAKGAAAWLNDSRWAWDYTYQPKAKDTPAKRSISNYKVL